MVYADYEYYSGTYMGTVSEEDFPRLAIRASSFLDYYTMGKAQKNADLDAVKMACCALVDKYAIIDAAQALAGKNLVSAAADGSEVKSETVGNYSRTLATGGEAALSALSATDSVKSCWQKRRRSILPIPACCIGGGGAAANVHSPHCNRLQHCARNRPSHHEGCDDSLYHGNPWCNAASV